MTKQSFIKSQNNHFAVKWRKEGVNDTEEQAIIRNNAYLDALVKEDINKVTNKKYNELRMLKIIESLSRFTASETTNVSIINDLMSLDESISTNSLVDYLDVLNKIYIIEYLFEI